MPVTVQHPSWSAEGHPPLAAVVPLVHIAPFPAGTVMHSDPSDDEQLSVLPPPPLPLPPDDDELHAVSVPVNARPTIAASAIPKS